MGNGCHRVFDPISDGQIYVRHQWSRRDFVKRAAAWPVSADLVTHDMGFAGTEPRWRRPSSGYSRGHPHA